MTTSPISDFLAALGLSPAGVTRMMPSAARVWKESPGLPVRQLLYTPGRVELVGKHTDYGGGASLVMAVEAGIIAAAVPDETGILRLEHLDAAERVVFRDTGGRWCPDGIPPFWARYPDVLLNRLAEDLPGLRMGGVLRFSSALPEAAGLSSSTAFLVTLFYGFLRLADGVGRHDLDPLWEDREMLASYLAAVEAGRTFDALGSNARLPSAGVGTDGGAQDQAAILLSRPGELLHLSYRPLKIVNSARLPAEWTVAVGSSGVTARKAEEVRGAFNELAAALEDGVRHWRAWAGAKHADARAAALPHLGALLAHTPAIATDPNEVEWAPEPLRPRIRQFAAESILRVPETLRSLQAGDGIRAGHWINASHDDGAAVLRNQVAETETLVRMARENGAAAASAFGAGFGGSVWALVRTAEAEAFLETWRQQYETCHPERTTSCHFLLSPPGPGAYAGLEDPS